MCTAVSYRTENHYFGRTLDLDVSYGEEICLLPRQYPIAFRHMGTADTHYAVLGMATVTDGVALFYDGMNECGLAAAGLNFPGNAVYHTRDAAAHDRVASFELIPWLLGRCRDVREARDALARLCVTDTPFRADLPPAPLHWMVCDRTDAIVVECRQDGMHVHTNPVGVLTNNPPFEHQLEILRRYRNLRNDNACVSRDENLPYATYSQGLGAVGLPGDVSSASRFVRAAFWRAHMVGEGGETASVGQFFHLLSSVEMIRGGCRTDRGTWDITVYTSCMSTDRGRYYYTTYGNRRISCVDLFQADFCGANMIRYPLLTEESIKMQN